MSLYLKSSQSLLILFFIVLAACQSDDPKPVDLTITALSPNHGSKGQAVILAGTGFSITLSENVVTLNDKICLVSKATSTSLTITIPAQAESGSITVKVKGQTAQSPLFTYEPMATVSTFAGSSNGYTDGSGINAQFLIPYSLAVATDGTLYVSDSFNAKIRKITQNGQVSTLAGGEQGYADGVGTNAQFLMPTGIAVGTDGTVYVADTGNGKIRRITPEGIVSTLVGGEQGYADGVGTNARFVMPTGITVAADGTVYVADAGNDRVRKITPAGLVSTFAVYGNSENIQFSKPTGIAISADGTLFVADANNHKIHKITSLGGVSTLSGNVEGAQEGLTNEAQFNTPTGIAVALDGTLYIADATNQRIRSITPSGWVRTLTGSNTGSTDGQGVIAKFYFPAGVALTTSGILYVADTGNSRIRKINLE